MAGRNFSNVRDAAAAAWNNELDAIRASGGAPSDTKIFYTGLYHALLVPSIFSDADGRYLGFDHKLHHVESGRTIYANFSGWDIYRSEMPLLALIEPRRMEDMVRSIVLMHGEGGWIGRWLQINSCTNGIARSPLTAGLARMESFPKKANPTSLPSIQSVTLNGRAQSRDSIPFGVISEGDRLQGALGPQPNRSSAAAPAVAPPPLAEARSTPLTAGAEAGRPPRR